MAILSPAYSEPVLVEHEERERAHDLAGRMPALPGSTLNNSLHPLDGESMTVASYNVSMSASVNVTVQVFLSKEREVKRNRLPCGKLSVITYYFSPLTFWPYPATFSTANWQLSKVCARLSCERLNNCL
jgi:hypothetical protein